MTKTETNTVRTDDSQFNGSRAGGMLRFNHTVYEVFVNGDYQKRGLDIAAIKKLLGGSGPDGGGSVANGSMAGRSSYTRGTRTSMSRKSRQDDWYEDYEGLDRLEVETEIQTVKEQFDQRHEKLRKFIRGQTNKRKIEEDIKPFV